MCGVGLVYSPNKPSSERNLIAEKMHAVLAHRGPNGFGMQSFDNANLTLFHRRLAIVDLSPSGHQPMSSTSGRWTISFNGEIYNYSEIKKQLLAQGVHFRGTSDTEVLLELIDHHGLNDAIKMCRGMFAIILWDNLNRELHLIRDRIGEKPLYYGHIRNDFVVASELKAFHEHPEFQPEINSTALSAYLKYNYVPTPLSIFKNVHKVESSTILSFRLDHFQSPKIMTYWSPRDWQTANQVHAAHSQQEAFDLIHAQLRETVQSEMHADVPLGCFLSGGIDSSLITAIMQEHSIRPIETFSIGFEDKQYDESSYAKSVAEKLGTHHTTWQVTADQALNIVPEISSIYDEPFSDSSQIPTVILSRLTRTKVTVALSGDGGDELFAGYTRYSRAPQLWNILKALPAPMRKILATAIQIRPQKLVEATYNATAALQSTPHRLHNLNSRIEKAKNYLDANSNTALFDRVLSHWHDPSSILLRGDQFSLIHEDRVSSDHFVPYMLWHDLKHYLPDDIMVKVDRASMSTSLETRAPFLDHKLVDLVHSFHPKLIQNPSQPKHVLRHLLTRYLPESTFNRPKMGFAVPLASWLREDLKDWMCDVLSESRVKSQGLFNVAQVSATIDAHLSGKQDHQHHLWDLIVFQTWYDKWMKN